MPLTQRSPRGLTQTRSLLNSLIEQPDLAGIVQALPAPAFSALIRKVGVEDAAELVALATTEQLVQAFDEDLFVSERAGEREVLDVDRLVVWLEVLLEAGDQAAADRIAELDEDFVAHALGGLLLVLDEDGLRDRLSESPEDEGTQVDKSIESALTEEIDGYILLAKQHEGWDAVLALVLALDRDHRALLVRLLDRLARAGSRYLDDLDALSSVLSEGESLAEDVEAAREERRSKQGYVETRSARAFLTLARGAHEGDVLPSERDPLTRAYFRELDRARLGPMRPAQERSDVPALAAAVLQELDDAGVLSSPLARQASPAPATTFGAFTEALRAMNRDEPNRFGERMEELAYLTNVLVAGHQRDGERLRPKEAADAVMATVCFGAAIELRAQKLGALPSTGDFVEILRRRSADLLFRVASSALASGAAPKVKDAAERGLLDSAEELERAL